MKEFYDFYAFFTRVNRFWVNFSVFRSSNCERKMTNLCLDNTTFFRI
jgi:hypothetical protein